MRGLPAIRTHGRALAAVAIFGTLLATLLSTSAGPAAAQGNNDWPAYQYGPDRGSYNAGATAITPSNAASLQQVWQWATPASPNVGTNQLRASPTVVNGVVYIGADDGYFYAVSESSHAVLWSDFLGLDTPKGTEKCGPTGQGIIATATVANDPVTGTPTVFVNSPDGNLYALNASTGAVVWQGLVDTPSTTANDYYAWGSPLVANGKVYVGISSDCDSPLIPGGLVSFDQSTGAQVARWLDTPTGRFQPGGSIWSSPTLLPNGQIVVTTGNGYDGSKQPLYDESIVRLDPNTLAVLDSWQVPPAQQISDADFGSTPTVWTATINGVSTPMIGACNKNGIFYAFQQDNLNAGPVWQTRITVPYPGGAAECISSAVWDGTRLIVGGGAATTINGVNYPGSVQALDPATGTPLWQTGVSGTIVGTPTEDGGGVVAAQTFSSTNKQLGVFLLNAATGANVGFIPTNAALFGQAVFVGSDLLVGAGGSFGLKAYEATTVGPPITGVNPSVIAPGKSTAVTLTGSGFSGTPTVNVTGGSVINVKSVSVTSPTTIKATLFAGTGATLGPRSITVTEPDLTTNSCTACLTVGTPPPPPAPTSIQPASFAPGSKSVPATIAGSGFVAGATATSHSGIKVTVTSFGSANQLNATVTVSSTLAPGNYNLFVYNPDGSFGECKGCITVS
jgi:outer membrane protein assembly factor BamB